MQRKFRVWKLLYSFDWLCLDGERENRSIRVCFFFSFTSFLGQVVNSEPNLSRFAERNENFAIAKCLSTSGWARRITITSYSYLHWTKAIEGPISEAEEPLKRPSHVEASTSTWMNLRIWNAAVHSWPSNSVVPRAVRGWSSRRRPA